MFQNGTYLFFYIELSVAVIRSALEMAVMEWVCESQSLCAECELVLGQNQTKQDFPFVKLASCATEKLAWRLKGMRGKKNCIMFLQLPHLISHQQPNPSAKPEKNPT